MDTDLNAPAIIAPDMRASRSAGASPADLPIEVDAPVSGRAGAASADAPGAPGAAPATTADDGPALLPRVRAEVLLADNQVYAAAELVRRGLARRVVLSNAAVDARLPDDWEFRGTPIHVDRLPDGRTRVTAGRPRAARLAGT